MESMLFDSNGELKTSITEIDIEKSLTVIDMRVNPWELQDSSSMEVDEGVIKQDKKSSSSSANANPHLQCRKDHLQVTWIVTSDQTSLCGSQPSTSSSLSAFSESACQSVSTHLHRQLRNSSPQHHQVRQFSSYQVMPSGHSASRERVKLQRHCLIGSRHQKRLVCSDSPWCLNSCHCHVSHAQMHGDSKGPNPDQ